MRATMTFKYDFIFIGGRKTALDDTMVRMRLPIIAPTHDVEAYFRAQEGDIRQAVAEALARDVYVHTQYVVCHFHNASWLPTILILSTIEITNVAYLFCSGHRELRCALTFDFHELMRVMTLNLLRLGSPSLFSL